MRNGCPQCVRKHLAKAQVLWCETQNGYPQHRDLVIGNMSEAEDEALQHAPSLAKTIRRHRRNYERDPTYHIPFSTLLAKVKDHTGIEGYDMGLYGQYGYESMAFYGIGSDFNYRTISFGPIFKVPSDFPKLITNTPSPTPQIQPQYRQVLLNDAALLSVVNQIQSLKAQIGIAKQAVDQAMAISCKMGRGGFGPAASCFRNKLATLRPAITRYNSLIEQHERLVGDFRDTERLAVERMTRNIPYKGFVIKPVLAGGTLRYQNTRDGSNVSRPSQTLEEAKAVIDQLIAEAQQAAVQQAQQERAQAEAEQAYGLRPIPPRISPSQLKRDDENAQQGASDPGLSPQVPGSPPSSNAASLMRNPYVLIGGAAALIGLALLVRRK